MSGVADPLERSVIGWGNRGWIEIVEFILETCLEGALKTHIMYECNLNSRQVTNYIEFLMDHKLVEGRPEKFYSKRVVYKTTERGRKYINAYNQLSEIFRQSVF